MQCFLIAAAAGGQEDSSWDLGTPSRWHNDNLRTSCHVDTCLLALSQAHLLDKELTKISKKLFFTSCPEFMSGWIMSWWQVRVNLGAIFYHFTTLFDDPCFIQHPAMTTTIALINFWQMIYVQLLLSGTSLWIILSSASLYLCWIVDSSSNDQWWCLKKENSLPFDRWSISILNPLTQRRCSDLRATPVQLEPLGTPIGSDGKNWLESKSESVSEFKSLPEDKQYE